MRRQFIPVAPLVLFMGAAVAQAPNPGPSRVVALTLDGVIHPISVEILSHALQQARDERAAIVLLRLNTPGGLMNSSREMVQRMVASPIPVVAYVTPSGGRAASAGFFLLEASDVAAMSPGSNTGAASPVLLTGQMDPVMRKKVENDASAWLRSLTTHRGRNTDLAEKTITEAKAFTDKEALDQHLIDLIAPDEQQLFTLLNGREIQRWDGTKQTLHLNAPIVTEANKTLRETIMSAIADPNIGFILLVAGTLGIYLEFTSPGLIAPGVVGAILLLLGFSALSVLPIDWAGVGLLVLALTFLILEAKFATHGVLGVGGAVAMVLGALLLVDGPPELRIHLATALAVSIPFAAITIFLVSLVVRARANKVQTGVSTMLRETGVARTPIAPSGQILIRGEYWNAVSSASIEAGQQVRVTGVDGLTLKVDPWSEDDPEPKLPA